MQKPEPSVLLRKREDSGGQLQDLGIDATILRVCWRTYSEALPILYGSNTFCFYSVQTLTCFRFEGLPLVHPGNNQRLFLSVFNDQPNPQGRLSMIRKLSLFLTWRYCQFAMRLPDLEPQPYRRNGAIEDWSPFLELSPYTDGSKFIGFPALEELELDFSDWDLRLDERLDVSPRLKPHPSYLSSKVAC